MTILKLQVHNFKKITLSSPAYETKPSIELMDIYINFNKTDKGKSVLHIMVLSSSSLGTN